MRPRDVCIAAVSGGPDSVALLYLLDRARDRLDVGLAVAHVHHGLRGADADADAAFVADLARRLGVPYHEHRADPAASRPRGTSVEEWARAVRYRFFDTLRAGRPDVRIALAHTADDQAETVLLFLLRGASSAGLRGMRRHRDDAYIRPLLGVTRAHLRRFLSEEGIASREDVTNRDVALRRNRVRLELLPYLGERLNPNAVQTLARAADILGEDEEVLVRVTDDALLALPIERGGGGVTFSRSPFVVLPVGLQRRILRRLVGEVRGELRGIGFAHIEAARHLALAGPVQGRVMLPAGLTVRRSYDAVVIAPARAEPSVAFERPLVVPGDTPLPEVGAVVEARIVPPAEVAPGTEPAGTAFLDYGALHPPLVLRSPRHGDRFRPLGMTGTKTVAHLLMDLRMPEPERHRVPLLVAGDRIVWVAGVRVAEEARVRPETQAVLRLQLRMQGQASCQSDPAVL